MPDQPPAARESTDLSVLTARSRLPAELRNASGMQKLEWVLGLPAPAEFIGALAPQELYHWLRDIGKEDAYPFLELATEEQLRGLVDIDAWSRHELSVPRWLSWLDLALAVDTDTAERFIMAQDDELLLALVTGDLQVLPQDTDLDAIPDELAFFPSPDGLFIVTVPREHPLEERLQQIMRLMWSADTDRARAVFQQAQVELSSSASDELERFRDARLKDLGFEPHHEALEVYSVVPIRALRNELEALAPDAPAASMPTATGMVGDLVLRGVEPPDLLRAAVSALEPRDRETFGAAFVYLANKVFMAETGDLSRLDDLPDAARSAVAMANLGLAYLAYESDQRAAEVVRQVTPEALFKVGWTLAFDVSKKARRVAARAGVAKGYQLFGSPTDEAIQAAALARPRYAQALDSREALGSRPFSTPEELARVEARVDEAVLLLDAFEAHFGLTLAALEEGDIGLDSDARRRVRLTTLVRTGLLHALLSDEFRFAPVTREQLVAFSRAAFTKDAALTPELRNTIDLVVGAALEGASDESREVFRALVDRAITELVEALGPVEERDLDLRYAGEIFLVAGA